MELEDFVLVEETIEQGIGNVLASLMDYETRPQEIRILRGDETYSVYRREKGRVKSPDEEEGFTRAHLTPGYNSLPLTIPMTMKIAKRQGEISEIRMIREREKDVTYSIFYKL